MVVIFIAVAKRKDIVLEFFSKNKKMYVLNRPEGSTPISWSVGTAVGTFLLCSMELLFICCEWKLTLFILSLHKGFSSKCGQIRCFLRIWSHLLKKFLNENFIFCSVLLVRICESEAHLEPS